MLKAIKVVGDALFMTYHSNRNFSLLTLGQFASIVGDRISTAVFLSIAVAIVASTQSTYQATIVIVFQTLPFLFLGYFFGLMADLVRKKNILIFADAARALVIVTLYFYHDSLIFLYFCVFLIGVLTAMFNPTKRAILPFLVKRESLIFFNKFFAMIEILALMVGLGFGAFLLSTIGIKNALLLDASTYIFSMILLLFLSYHDEDEVLERERRGTLANEIKRHTKELKEGLVYLWNHNNLRYLIINLVFFHFLAVAVFTSAVIDFSVRTFDSGREYLIGLGFNFGNMLVGSHTTFILLFVAIGALASPLIKMMFSRVRESVLSVYAFIVGGIAAIILVILSIILPMKAFYPIFIVSMVLMGMVVGLQYLRIMYLVQMRTDKEFMGRVVSVNDLVWSSSLAVGMLVGAYINEIFTYKAGLLIGGVIYLMGAASFYFSRKKIDW